MDLSTATMPELIEEIAKRADAALVVVLMPDRIGKGQTPELSFSGGPYTALGLLESAKAALISPPHTDVELEEEDDP